MLALRNVVVSTISSGPAQLLPKTACPVAPRGKTGTVPADRTGVADSVFTQNVLGMKWVKINVDGFVKSQNLLNYSILRIHNVFK